MALPVLLSNARLVEKKLRFFPISVLKLAALIQLTKYSIDSEI